MAESTERFLVTGAGGCIGAWVIAQLAREGTYVVGLDLATDSRRLREIANDELADSVMVERGDVTSKPDIEAAIDAHKITNVIHLAALQIPFCRADPVLGAEVNVVGTVNLFEAVRERADRIKGLTYASSVALFGRADAELALAEERGIGTSPETLYGVYKQANEGSARVYWQETQVPSIGLRPSTVFGPGRDQGVTSAPTLAIGAAVRGERHTIPFGGSSLYNFAPDVAAAFIQSSRALDTGAHVFNVPGSDMEMADVVASIDRAVPGASTLIDFDSDVTLPIPARFTVQGLATRVGAISVTPFDEAVDRTAEHFRAAA